MGSSEPSATTQDVAQTSAKPSRGRMTGPRTTGGKNRTRYNAVKAGIFSKVVVLKNESRTEYEALLTGYRDHFQPQGAFENVLLEKLAMIDWRRKRLVCAETAEIESSTRFKTVDSLIAQKREAEDVLGGAETPSGMLKHDSNPYVLEDAIWILKRFRDLVECAGFREEEDYDTGPLEKVYGVGQSPLTLLHMFLVMSKMAAVYRKQSNEAAVEKLERLALKGLDGEIDCLGRLLKGERRLAAERQEYSTSAALVPEQSTTEKFVRYEAHLSREFDRTLNQLERCQRIRLGQPVLPAIKADVTS